MSDRDMGRLDHIPIGKIHPNPDNPRTTFRQGELEELQESIRQYGVQVPIAVFKRGADYVLIDGERRWRCASKLNLRVIPALVQKEPGPLENLLLMFNIHALREQWDLLTIALKLPKIIGLLEVELGVRPTEAQLSEKTGLSRGVLRRCRLLADLPDKYKKMLLEELKKPKSKQLLSEDFFIEMEKALRTVERAMPDAMPSKEKAREILLRKYRTNVIDNIVDLRKIPKIARAHKVGASPQQAQDAIRRLLTDPEYTIEAAWAGTVSDAYAERDIVSRIEHLIAKLQEVGPEHVDDDVREKLEELIHQARLFLDTNA